MSRDWSCETLRGSSPRGRGTRGRERRHRWIQSVHPRAGGEHVLTVDRGACRDRFIPARAGNTPGWDAQTKREAGSSPRGRGTLTRFMATRNRRAGGSSPRGRGTLKCSSLPAPRPRRAPVHPRAGGEHQTLAIQNLRGNGSSPRGRGTPDRLRSDVEPARFIPARAGNTSGTGRRPSKTTVHPRAGGEHKDSL